MTDYTLNTPASNQLQSVSQGIMLDNCNALDERFGIDHYEYSLALPPSGYHKQVTTPDRGSHPSGATYPALYGKAEATTNLGLMQYIKPVNRVVEGNQVSTPLTIIQSSETAIVVANGASTNILDFTGISRCFGRAIVGNIENGNRLLTICDFWFFNNSGTPIFKRQLSGDNSSLNISSSSFILQANNTSGSVCNQIFWNIQFQRIQI